MKSQREVHKEEEKSHTLKIQVRITAVRLRTVPQTTISVTHVREKNTNILENEKELTHFRAVLTISTNAYFQTCT